MVRVLIVIVYMYVCVCVWNRIYFLEKQKYSLLSAELLCVGVCADVCSDVLVKKR